MSEQYRDISFQQAFACGRFDSAAREGVLSIPSHSHYSSEVLLVRSGICRVVRGSHTFDLKPGELLYIAPLVRHSVSSADNGPLVFDIVKFSATRLREIPSYLSDLRSMSLDAAHAHTPIQMNAEEVQRWHLDSIISECIVENTRREYAWDLHIRALICLLITGLCRFWITRREAVVEQEPKEHDPIMDIPAYIEQHIDRPLRVEELAKRCSLSYPWFAKRFHELFGLSCKQFIEHIRTENVEQYLLFTDLDLAEISARTGYTDCSHMVKDFRRMTGTTPGQFRSAMKNQGATPFSGFSVQSTPNHPSKG